MKISIGEVIEYFEQDILMSHKLKRIELLNIIPSSFEKKKSKFIFYFKDSDFTITIDLTDDDNFLIMKEHTPSFDEFTVYNREGDLVCYA